MAFLVEGNETLLWILVETLNNNYYYPSLNYWVLTEYADAVIKNWYLLKWISLWSILGQHGIEVLQSTCVSIMKQSTRQCNYIPAIRNLDIFIVDLTHPPPHHTPNIIATNSENFFFNKSILPFTELLTEQLPLCTALCTEIHKALKRTVQINKVNFFSICRKVNTNVRNVRLDAQFTSRFTRAWMTPFKQFWQANKKKMLCL